MLDFIPRLLKRFSKRKKKHSLNKTHYGVMYAVMNEDEASLRSAIKAGACLNSPIDLDDTTVTGGVDSKTPLHWVASRGNSNFLKLLLDAGADPNSRGTRSGRTPLLECSDNIECSRLLLVAGGNVNTVDFDGNGVLHYAATTEHFSYLQFRYLVNSGAVTGSENRLGETPLHRLCSYSGDTVHRARAVALCIQRGCNVNTVDYNGRTALHLASANSNEQCVQELIRSGALVDGADYDGMTPLHFASRRRGADGCVAILLNSGAEPDYDSVKSGYTSLQLAVQHNNVPTVRLLLHYGSQPFSTFIPDICRRSCCVRHTTCLSRSSLTHPTLASTTDESSMTSSQLIVSNALGSVPSLQALCRLKIRRVAGPEGLSRLQTLQQPPHTPFLRNTTRPNNTELSHIKRKTSLLQDRKPSLVEDNRDGEEKYRSSEVVVVEAAELMPSPIRRYLLHCDEYELWWDQKQQNKKFAFAASVGGDRYMR